MKLLSQFLEGVKALLQIAITFEQFPNVLTEPRFILLGCFLLLVVQNLSEIESAKTTERREDHTNKDGNLTDCLKSLCGHDGPNGTIEGFGALATNTFRLLVGDLADSPNSPGQRPGEHGKNQKQP